MNNLEEQLQNAYNTYNLPPDQQESINKFLELLEKKDRATYEHSIRVGLCASKIGDFLKINGKALLYAGLLHDVGKSRIDTEILTKTEGFNDEDYKKIQQHVEHSYQLLKGVHDFSADIAVRHHQYQETKYPDVLPEYCKPYSQETKEKIDYYALILSLADFYDAATTRVNNKSGTKKQLTKTEVKQQLFNKYPYLNKLIEDLYENNIFEDEKINQEKKAP
ncbi:MAG: HD-GYP domain-containing protein [Candidatus Nanoarchaeia archaeon]